MKKVHVLDFQFKILTISGIWRPLVWASKPQLILYSLYSFFCCFLIVSMAILQCLLLVLTEIEFKMLTGTLITVLTSFSVCVKLLNFLLRRKKIIGLMNMLSRSWCLPKNKKEEAIQKRSDNFMRIYSIIMCVMGNSTVASMLVLPLLFSDEKGLPIPVWLPSFIWNNIWIAYVYETMAMFATVMVNANSDVAISGLMWEACTQFDIARHRLEELPRRLRQAIADEKTPRETLMRIEKESLELAAFHHNHIIEYAAKVNGTINIVVVVQFFVSCLIISIIVFELSSSRDTGLFAYVVNILYLSCILIEFFGFCWFGNEITLKCEEFGRDIYRIDWCSLSLRVHRMLMFIVLRTRKPVVLSVGHFVVLNLESFKSILKVSFSAFNVLKESA